MKVKNKKFEHIGIWFIVPSFRDERHDCDSTYRWFKQSAKDEFLYLRSLNIDSILLANCDDLEFVKEASEIFDVVTVGAAINEETKEIYPDLADFATLDKLGVAYLSDEPDGHGVKMETVTHLVKEMEEKNRQITINFCGASLNVNHINYAYEYLKKYPLKHVSADIYTVHFHGSANMVFFEERVKRLRDLAKEKFQVILPAFSKIGSRRIPSIEQLEEMVDICYRHSVDKVEFFLWTSGKTTSGENLFGLDALPLEYHKFLATCNIEP